MLDRELDHFNVNINVILFENIKLANEENARIFLTTQKVYRTIKKILSVLRTRSYPSVQCIYINVKENVVVLFIVYIYMYKYVMN